MQFSELVLHQTYKNFPMPTHPLLMVKKDHANKGYLAIKNLNLNNYQHKHIRENSRDVRKNVSLQNKKQLTPFIQNQHRNMREDLLKRTQEVLKRPGTQAKYRQKSPKQQSESFKKSRYLVKGKVLSLPFSLLNKSENIQNGTSQQFNTNKSFNFSNFSQRDKRDQRGNKKLKEYLNSSMRRTMLIRKVETANQISYDQDFINDKDYQPRLASVRLNREKQYDSYRKQHKDSIKIQENINRSLKASDPKKQFNYHEKRASTSHQNHRNFKPQGSTEQLEPW